MASAGDKLPIGTIILAGGLSRRMGRHKALIPLGNSTFIGTIATCHEEAGAESILAVTHRGVFDDPAFPQEGRFDLLVLDEPTESPLHTLRAALDRIGTIWRAFLLHPVDYPLVKAATVRAMITHYLKRGAAIVQPLHGGRGGHPVLIDMSLLDEIRAAPSDEGLRHVVRADPGRVERLVVDDPGVRRGMNSPADLEGL
jgi:molybdenum cofactor cytidylyltransferase